MFLFGAIIVVDLAHDFADPSTSFNLIDISGWNGPRVFLNLLPTVYFLCLLLNFEVRSFAVS